MKQIHSKVFNFYWDMKYAILIKDNWMYKGTLRDRLDVNNVCDTTSVCSAIMDQLDEDNENADKIGSHVQGK